MIIYMIYVSLSKESLVFIFEAIPLHQNSKLVVILFQHGNYNNALSLASIICVEKCTVSLLVSFFFLKTFFSSKISIYYFSDFKFLVKVSVF